MKNLTGKIFLLMLFAQALFGQITGFIDDFENGSVDTTWGETLHRLWDTEDTSIFHISEDNGVLTIGYDRKSTDRAWPCMFFTPPENIDVSVNPQVSIKIRSDVAITYQFKPVYNSGANDWKVVDIAGDNIWRTYIFNLESSNYSGTLMNRIYIHFDGGATPEKTGTVCFDDLKIAGFSINVSGLTAITIDSSHINLNWECDKTADHFNIYRDTVSGFALDSNSMAGVSTSTSYQDSGLRNNSWYYYRVSAVDANGIEYNPSAEVQCRTYSPGTAPLVTVASVNTTPVGKYEKFEITLELVEDSWSNPYDPEQIDLFAIFITPDGDSVRVNGFYDNYQNRNTWTIRFSPYMKGNWEYQVFATDIDGTGYSPKQSFTATESTYHGSLQVSSDNLHYLKYHDGTSFFGIAAYYPWGVANTASGLGILESSGGNLFGYWNGNYDGAGNGGGIYQIESVESGIGHYDQRKCARMDEILEWAEERNLEMMFAIWPHDVLDENTWGYNGWSENSYKQICESEEFYGDNDAWKYQQKLYRYIIARWGYSRSLGIWELVNEIDGTDGWAKGDQSVALQWVQKVHDYFKANDPYQRPTTISKGGGSSNYWRDGYSICDLPNVHLYETGWAAKYSGDPVRSSYWTYRNVARQLWSDFNKPGIFGEAGAGAGSMYADVVDGSADYAEIYHNAIWASWASGLAFTPVWWEMNNRSLMSDLVFAQMQAFSSVSGDLPYSRNNLQLNRVSATDCDAFGMYSDSLGFGWIRKIIGALENEPINIEDLSDGTYLLNWHNTWSGALISSDIVVSAYGELIDSIPDGQYSEPDIAYTLRSTSNGSVPHKLHLFMADNLIVPVIDTVYNVIGIVCDADGRLVPMDGMEITLNLSGSGTLVEYVLNTSNGMVLVQFIPSGGLESVVISAQAEGLISAHLKVEYLNALTIDDFENYVSDAQLTAAWTTSVGPGAACTLSLSGDTLSEGEQSLKFSYQLNLNSSFAAILKSLDGSAFLGANYLSLWLYPGVSGRVLEIGLREGSNLYWKMSYTIDNTEPTLVQIPLEELTSSSSSGIDLGKVNAFYINVTPGSGILGGGEVVFIDNIRLSYHPVSTIENPHKGVSPSEYALSQNYPNPFNASTAIAYSLPVNANVRIEVYDLNGRRVTVLTDGYRQAGQHRMIWRPDNLASGVYFIRLTSGDYSAHRKCMHLK